MVSKQIEPSTRSELVEYAIRDVVQEAKKIERQGVKMSYLNIGDPASFGFRPPQHILDAAADALKQNYSGYAPSEGDPDLRRTVAEYEKVAPDDVFITMGLTEGIDFLFHALVDPGKSILLPAPTYPLYISKERTSYGPMEFYGCDEDYEPDVESLRKKISRFTKAIVVINPNNPTGAVYRRKTLQGIVDIAGEHNIPIISDDVYDQLVFDGEMVTMRSLAKDVPIVCGNSLSKNYIYPGARAGYLAFHGQGWDKVKETIQRLCNARLSVNWEMQRAYIAAIKGPKDHITKFNGELKGRRDIVVRRINAIDGLSIAVPKGAFYAYIRIKDDRWKTDGDFVRGLLKHGVVAVPGAGFGPDMGDKAFRVVYLAKPEQLEDAFDKIEKYMNE